MPQHDCIQQEIINQLRTDLAIAKENIGQVKEDIRQTREDIKGLRIDIKDTMLEVRDSLKETKKDMEEVLKTNNDFNRESLNQGLKSISKIVWWLLGILGSLIAMISGSLIIWSLTH